MNVPDDGVINLDARSMRGIAHPLRVRLLGELRLHGPSTATRLGERLGQSSGATSYHLRQLAAFNAERPVRAIDELPLLPAPWSSATAFVDSQFRLTAAGAQQLKDEIVTVLSRYREDSDAAPADAASVAAVFHLRQSDRS